MKRNLICLLGFLSFAIPAGSQPNTGTASAATANTGTIRGHVHLIGELPGNPIIRMGMDPMCSKINAGKQIVQPIVAADLKGNLANVFVSLQGNFPPTPVPSKPVVIDQRACIYGPRVAGMRLGQTLEVKNEDPLIHNVHAVSAEGNGFNMSTPATGGSVSFRPKKEEIMLRIGCDVHRWMTAYVGVVNHPYFAVSGSSGTFEIAKIPPGTYTIQAWHERYGPVTRTIKITAGSVTNVDFTYNSDEKSSGKHR